MKKQLFAAAVAAASVCAPVLAQEIKGDITLGYSAFWDDTSLNALSGTSSLEVGIGQRASAQLDFGMYGFGFSDSEAANLVLHGIFDVNAAASVGLFLGVEDFAGDRYDFYGLEYGQGFGAGSFEVYAARGEDAGISGTVIGAEGTFAVNDLWGVGVKLDNGEFDNTVEARRVGVKGIHALGQGTSLFAEVGSATISAGGASVSEPFVGVGLNFKFGSDKATFGQRSFSGLFPGL